MRERRASGATIVTLALVGIVIAGYLAATKLTGGVPVCGPLRGCETVNTSSYSEILGIPVALFGLLYSGVILGAGVVWWRAGDPRALYVAYGLGLLGLLAVVYLTYLELFVIGAICVWCVGYAVTVIGAWVVAVLALRGASRA